MRDKVIEISWQCKCGNGGFSCWQADPNETLESLKGDIFRVYCDECETEFKATTENCYIKLVEG